MTVQLYNLGKVWAATNKVTPLSIMTFFTVLMKQAENLVLKDHDGQHKEKAVLTAVRLVLQDKEIVKVTDEERTMILTMVEHWGAPFVETLVQAVHDPMGTIGKISKAFQKISSCCIPADQKKKQ